MNVLALCSGYGGLDVGVRLARPEARVVCHIEREAAAVAGLVVAMDAGFLHPAPVWSDLRTFDPRPWRGKVHCVTGGYPCQPFSHAGRRGGESDPRHLWPVIRDILECLRPERAFFENVSGHVSLGLEAVLSDLSRLGYQVACGLFTAEEVGASHRRERIFILAHAERDGRRQGSEVLRAREPEFTSCRQDALAHADRQRSEHLRKGTREPHGQDPETADRAERCSSALEHAPRVGRREGRAEPELRCGRDAAAEPGGVVGDSRSDGRRQSAEVPQGREPEPTRASQVLPLFPPGPGDLDAWRSVLDARPDLAPATAQPGVRRVADGLAVRIHRLRGLGNGVVPLQAAYAWRVLEAALAVEATALKQQVMTF